MAVLSREQPVVSKVLIIDDDRLIRLAVQRGLSSEGFEVIEAANAAEGLAAVDAHRPDVALVDVFMPEMNGLELFRKIRALDRKLPMIFVTSDTSSETTIEAMRLGAFDYLAKPINLQQLKNMTASAAESRRLMDHPVALSLTGEAEVGERFVGRSGVMLEVLKAVGRVAGQDVTVLVRGESGTGKDLVARAIVQHSNRKDFPFVAVNCAAIPDQLLESELFGHEKGAFTGAERRRVGKFEQCDNGSIFLDEVGDMSPLVQGKVLRLLQDQSFQRVGGNEEIRTNVRIVAATNRNLEQMVIDGDFREDLFYRLNGFTIQLPPLRERSEDIPLLLEYFLRRARKEMNKNNLDGLSPAALALLKAYHWPGNVRQLQSVVRQAVLNTTGTVLGEEALPSIVTQPRTDHSPKSEASNPAAVLTTSAAGLAANSLVSELSPGLSAANTAGSLASVVSSLHREDPMSMELGESELTAYSGAEAGTAAQSIVEFIESRLHHSTDLYAEAMRELERYLFTRVLETTGGNQSRAAEILGITRGKVRDRIAAFNIQLDRTVTVGSNR
ncbi:MAG: sigma-54-dependent Fis family transcriptional regulator [Pirellulaceae bacterium]|nr:sigma-54-dependent Fis family transcriptional regulator [Pirellulaceae bacterium]